MSNLPLKHKVTIVKITRAEGGRTTENIPNVDAFISEAREVVRSVSGDIISSATVVILAANTDINEGDEIIVDGRSRAISKIVKPRFAYSSQPIHVEVYLD